MSRLIKIGIGIIVVLSLCAITYLGYRQLFLSTTSVEPQNEEQEVVVVVEEEIENAAVTRKSLPQAEDKPPKPFAPNFSLPQIGADTSLELASYRGDKPVILDFFATWCHNCQRDMPVLNELYQKYQEQVEVIVITGIQEDIATVTRYMKKNNMSAPFVFDAGGESMRDYAVQFTNTHVLIDKEGFIVDQFPTDISEEHFELLINNNF